MPFPVVENLGHCYMLPDLMLPADNGIVCTAAAPDVSFGTGKLVTEECCGLGGQEGF